MTATCRRKTFMAIEIERRWLLSPSAIPPEVLAQARERMVQGYLTQDGALPVVRIRLIDVPGAPLRAVQTVKALRANGEPGVEEIEFDIPTEQGLALLPLCMASLEKERITAPMDGGLKMEIDIFTGHPALEGLCIAEIEVPHPDYPLTLPAWFGPEVTGIKLLSNVSMAYQPYPAKNFAQATLAQHAACQGEDA